jgi:hypothetical protein
LLDRLSTLSELVKDLLEILSIFAKFVAVALYMSFDDSHELVHFLSTTMLGARLFVGWFRSVAF